MVKVLLVDVFLVVVFSDLLLGIDYDVIVLVVIDTVQLSENIVLLLALLGFRELSSLAEEEGEGEKPLFVRALVLLTVSKLDQSLLVLL